LEEETFFLLLDFSTAFLISQTRDFRSFLDLIAVEVLVSACSTPISLPQITSGCLKPGVVTISGMFRVLGSRSMCWKAAIPRRPLRGQQKKSQQFKYLSVTVDLTVQCFDVDLSSN
jgi:hypothetical protein